MRTGHLPGAGSGLSLWLVRHAAVPGAEGRCYGALDWPADPDATRGAASDLAARLPHGLAVFSSPRLRCLQLARALHALRPDLACRTDVRLQELDFGSWEGRPWDQIARAELDAWTTDFVDYCPGGSGENMRCFMARVGAAWQDWQAGGRQTLWVTHAGVIRAILFLRDQPGQMPRAASWPRQAVAHGALLHLPREPPAQVTPNYRPFRPSG